MSLTLARVVRGRSRARHVRLRRVVLAVTKETEVCEMEATLKSRMPNPVFVTPGAMEALQALAASTANRGVTPELLELINLRVSQINGCSVCVDLHTRGLKRMGDSEERIVGAGAWRHSPYFSDAERTTCGTRLLSTTTSRRSRPSCCRSRRSTSGTASTSRLASLSATGRADRGTRPGKLIHLRHRRAPAAACTVSEVAPPVHRRRGRLPSGRVVPPDPLPTGGSPTPGLLTPQQRETSAGPRQGTGAHGALSRPERCAHRRSRPHRRPPSCCRRPGRSCAVARRRQVRRCVGTPRSGATGPRRPCSSAWMKAAPGRDLRGRS